MYEFVVGNQADKPNCKAGRIAVVLFSVDEELQVGTSLHQIENSKIKVVSETGAMVGML